MASNKISIRLFNENDKDAVYNLVLSIMEQEFEDIQPSIYLNDLEDIANSYGSDGDVFLVCEYDKKVIGTMGIKRDDEKSALMRRFFVNPNHRRKGVGSALIQEGIAFCKKKKYKKIFFDGNTKMHKVKALLEKEGFAEEESIALSKLNIFKLAYKL